MTSVARSSGKPTYVDVESGLVDRRIFFDPDIYQLELERIFARALELHVPRLADPEPGRLLHDLHRRRPRHRRARQRQAARRSLVNSCRHRGNAVCRADEGHATSLHVHLPRLDLRPEGQPRRRARLQGGLPRGARPRELGPDQGREGRQLQGLRLRDHGPGGAGLDEYLGEVGRSGIDLLAERGDDQGMSAASRSTRCPATGSSPLDNVWDCYHAELSHASPKMARAEYGGPAPNPNADPNPVRAIYLSEFGHCTMADSARSLFPNVFFNSLEIEMRMPKGPGVTELWRFSFYGEALGRRKEGPHSTSPKPPPRCGGVLRHRGRRELDGLHPRHESLINRRHPFNYSMNLGRGQIVHGRGASRLASTRR